MKKLLVTLLVVSFMVLTMAAAALASNVYVDGLVSGKGESKYTDATDPSQNSDTKGDLNGYTVGANLNSGRLLINFDYSKDTSKTNTAGSSNEDQNTFNIKCGYLLSGDEENYLALTAGYYQMEPDENPTDQKFDGIIIGLNAVSNPSERTRLEGSLGYSVDGSLKFQALGANLKYDLTTLLLQVKYSYYLTENFGLGFGYKYTQYKVDGELFESKATEYGPTVGLTYRF